MTLESQIRRGLFSIAALVGLSVVVAAQGHSVIDQASVTDLQLAQCDALEWNAEPVAARGAAESNGRADWRALLPAMIFTSNR